MARNNRVIFNKFERLYTSVKHYWDGKGGDFEGCLSTYQGSRAKVSQLAWQMRTQLNYYILLQWIKYKSQKVIHIPSLKDEHLTSIKCPPNTSLCRLMVWKFQWQHEYKMTGCSSRSNLSSSNPRQPPCSMSGNCIKCWHCIIKQLSLLFCCASPIKAVATTAEIHELNSPNQAT